MTPIQKEIIRLSAEENLNVSAIARKMFLCNNTVRYHIAKIKEQTGLDSLNFFDLIKLLKMCEEKPMTNYDKIKSAGVEVVRCENCIYGEKDPDCDSRYYNYLCRYDGDSWNDADYFCADGEEKIDDKL